MFKPKAASKAEELLDSLGQAADLEGSMGGEGGGPADGPELPPATVRAFQPGVYSEDTVILPGIAGELWWGGVVQNGGDMPYGRAPWAVTLGHTNYNQANPVMVSNKGRYLWSENPATTVHFKKLGGDVVVKQATNMTFGVGHKTLRGAYLAAAKAHFPATGRVPDPLLFTAPQYNLWIELNYYPTQEKVLAYAEAVVEHGFPPGVIMIDTNWSEFYGNFEFCRKRFPDPAAMAAKLHEMGFKVMVWLSPFLSPDSTVFRDLKARDLLVRNIHNQIAISEWWDGYSALLDFTNPAAADWLAGELGRLQDLGVDGFKFDGGDPWYYTIHGDGIGHGKANAHEHLEAFERFGLRYNMSEYRAGWKMAGTHLVQRLADKNHKWDKNGLGALVPNGLAQSILGYAFTCPDMIGGGQYTDFYEPGTLQPKAGLDEELFVRYAQTSALFPMMQFSLAPWRVLSAPSLKLVADAARLHAEFADAIVALAREAAETNEPIIRSMEYVFPDQGLEDVRDQFMLGDDVLVAPVLEQGAHARLVQIPAGEWEGFGGAQEWETTDGKYSSEDRDHVTGPQKVSCAARPFGKLAALAYFKRRRT